MGAKPGEEQTAAQVSTAGPVQSSSSSFSHFPDKETEAQASQGLAFT